GGSQPVGFVGHAPHYAAWGRSTTREGLLPAPARYTRRPMTETTVRERVFSGIQPSGASHLGNSPGAQANYVALQDRYEAIYAIVDYHAMTTVHDGLKMRELTPEMVLDLLAVGLA